MTRSKRVSAKAEKTQQRNLQTLGQIERIQIERRQTMEKQKNKILVFAFGFLRKPKYRARDFWIVFPCKISINDLRERLNNHFGDLLT